jgi:hypothetical protein
MKLLKEIRKECEEQGLLHLAHYRHNSSLTIEQWLKKFLNELNYEKDTLNAEEEIDTYAGKRRSLGDIYRIARTYYPKLKLKELASTLYSIRNEFHYSLCNTIKKQVFYSKKDGANRQEFNHEDEYGRTLESYTKIKRPQ